MKKQFYSPGDLVVFNDNATPARILEMGRDQCGFVNFSVIVRRGGERTVHYGISPDMVQPLTMVAIANLIGGPSNVDVLVDGCGHDYTATVLCDQPEIIAA
jgi:hypothetical protein